MVAMLLSCIAICETCGIHGTGCNMTLLSNYRRRKRLGGVVVWCVLLRGDLGEKLRGLWGWAGVEGGGCLGVFEGEFLRGLVGGR